MTPMNFNYFLSGRIIFLNIISEDFNPFFFSLKGAKIGYILSFKLLNTESMKLN